ncbi:DNA-directed RNA polymerase subunit alpha [Candidatus Marinamargulisbacteria bacterium SCGC AG-410-N11]|nr:DNA-directed RNA polymerase subunit alpha [Candidatus Marinamargulisbacteria bacterium SCGC AG-410-N11]
MNKQSWVNYEVKDDVNGRFVISPLDRGMGTTLGNSLRRVLLSSLEGMAVVSVKIDGVNHEFSTLPNVVTDVIDIISNIKSVVFVSDSKEHENVNATINVKGKKVITANDIKLPSHLRIINDEQYIAEITGNGELNIDIEVAKGKGYVVHNPGDSKEIDRIFLDASYSPIETVNFEVENIRVGDQLNNDKLILNVKTDGSIDSENAVKKAVKLLSSQLEVFDRINEKPEEEEAEVDEDNANQINALDMSIDDLELSARSSNCLKRAAIESVGELIEKDMSELIKIKNFGKKSADEINTKLKQYNLALKGTEI